ncbi:MAG: PAS domain S-box protein [Methanomassiliicoccales archaeon]
MMRVILIDDELDLAEVTRDFLELSGQMHVSVAGSALEGLEQLKRDDYDAVVSDYQMPLMDGLQLLKKLRQEGNNIPFILFTGKGREEVVIEALNSGADFYLQKGGQPVAQFAELAHKIRQAVHSRRSESALIESEQRFKDLFESMGSGVAIYSVRNDGNHGSDYIVKDFNRKALQIEGKRREEVVGKSLFELRPRIDEYGLIPMFREVWITGKAAFYPAKVYIDDHYFSWYQNTVFRLISGEIVAIYEDVSEQQRAEEALLDSEARYRSLVENSFEGIWIMDGDSITTYVNQRMADMLHLRPEDMVGRSVTEFLLPGQDEEHEERMQQRMAGVKARYEHCFYLADGSSVHCMVSAVPIMGPDGSFQGSVGVFMDISEMRQTDAAMRERQMKLDSLFKAAPVGMGFVKDRTYLEVNRRTEEMTGYSAAELVGQSTRMLYESDEEYQRVGREKYGELDRVGIGTTATKWRRKDGTFLPIQLTSAAIVPGDRSQGVCFIAIELAPLKHR